MSMLWAYGDHTGLVCRVDESCGGREAEKGCKVPVEFEPLGPPHKRRMMMTMMNPQHPDDDDDDDDDDDEEEEEEEDADEGEDETVQPMDFDPLTPPKKKRFYH